MGRLGKQPLRGDYSFTDTALEERAIQLKQLAADISVPLEALVKIEMSMQLNRLNSILIEDGNNMDENLAGLGEILKESR